MQRKALKQLGKVTQWTHEKVFSGERTQLSSEFQEFERDVEVNRIGIESLPKLRLHATSMPFFENITKVKQSADPQTSSKEKILYTEALGLVMIDYGNEMRDTYGDALKKYGRTRCKLAEAQAEFGSRLRDNYIAGMERSLAAVNEYKTFRKKLDSRRLALDSAISKMNTSKKEKDRDVLEQEVDIARERFEEVQEETAARMEAIQAEKEDQLNELADLLEAELDYFARCKDLLDELRVGWPSGSVSAPVGRPRAGTGTSSRSIRRGTGSARPSAPASSDEEDDGNRPRSSSNASAGSAKKGRRSMLPSFGSFGRKSKLDQITKPKRKGWDDDGHAALNSEESMDDDFDTHGRNTGYSTPLSPRAQFALNGRTRSTSTMQSAQIIPDSPSYAAVPPPMRRTYTAPSLSAKYVKALYDFEGSQSDELKMRVGMVIEVKHELSDDWWVGESEGKSGMFPSAYVEEYLPSPTTAMNLNGGGGGSSSRNDSKYDYTQSLAPERYSSLPPRGHSPTNDYHITSDSELSGYDDADHYTTASLSAEAAALSSLNEDKLPQNRSRSSTLTTKRAPAPPPPSSRRTRSSTNVNLPSSSSDIPPVPNSRSRAGTASSVSANIRSRLGNDSDEASPFMSPEELEDPVSNPVSRSHTPGVSSINTGMGGLVLPKQTAQIRMGRCEESGCDCNEDEFTQNVFKAKGMCSSCYHEHRPL